MVSHQVCFFSNLGYLGCQWVAISETQGDLTGWTEGGFNQHRDITCKNCGWFSPDFHNHRVRLTLRVFSCFFHRLPEGWPNRNSFHSPVWDRMKQHGVTSSSETFSLWLDDLDGLKWGGIPILDTSECIVYPSSGVWLVVTGTLEFCGVTYLPKWLFYGI